MGQWEFCLTKDDGIRPLIVFFFYFLYWKYKTLTKNLLVVIYREVFIKSENHAHMYIHHLPFSETAEQHRLTAPFIWEQRASLIWTHAWGFFANKPSIELDTKGMRAFLVLYTLVSWIQHWKLAQGYWMILHISSPLIKHKYEMKEFDASKIFALRNAVTILEWKCKCVPHLLLQISQI